MTKTWRNDPFRAGAHYRVLKSFSVLRDTFREGEILQYQESAHSHYHGYSGFFFIDEERKIRSWDLGDGDSLEVWRELFEEIPVINSSSGVSALPPT